MFLNQRTMMAAAAVLVLGACNGSVVGASAERDKDTDALLADLAAGRDDELVARMSSANSPEQVRAQLPFLKTLVPPGAVPAGKTSGWQAFAGTGGMTYSMTRAYDYPDRTLNVASSFLKEGEAWKVQGFNINLQMKPGAAAPIPVAPAPAPSEPVPPDKATTEATTDSLRH